MERCFRCNDRHVITQWLDVPFRAMKMYWVYVEAQVCQKCGFHVFTDAQADAYQKATQPHFDEYIADLKAKKSITKKGK